jgi:hypothetical protein
MLALAARGNAMHHNKHSIGICLRVATLCLSLGISIAAFAINTSTDNERLFNVNHCQTVNLTQPAINVLLDNSVDQNFQLLGKAKLSVLFWDIYESQLFTSDGKLPFSHSCQYSLFEITYLRDISKQELLESTIAQWQYLAIDENEYRSYLAVLEYIWPDIKVGDQLTLLNKANISVFYFNQKKIGEIESKEFANLFLRIWLDENTSEPELRKQLLGDLI